MSAIRKVLSNPIVARILLRKQMEKLEKCVAHKLKVNLNFVSSKKPLKTVDLPFNGGTLIGFEEKLPLHGTYVAFQGIPYAEPPIGPRRFAPPVPMNYCNKTLNCTKEGEMSLQPDMFTKEPIGAESCLFLNVYTPSMVKNSKLPVMVYIHGGGFIFGSGNVSDHSPEYLVQEGVVVVTFNYRLNVLGFLHLPSGGIVGNQAFRDQRLALKWVSENIEKFGGDSRNITLFGHSAGAAAAHLHMMLPESKKYFHKAILQSGSSTMDWFMQFDPENNARRMARIMGCRSKDDREIAKFLKEANAKIMATRFSEVLTPQRKKRGLPLVFSTVLEDKNSENPFLTETVDHKLERPEQIDMPLMMGVTEHDGMVMAPPQMKRQDLWNSQPGRFIPRTVNVDGDSDTGECKILGDRIKNFYLQGKPLSEKTFDEFMDFMSDYNFNIPIQSAVEFHSRFQHKSSNVYYYQFSYDGELNMMKKLLGFDMKGANHGDELTYLFVMKMAEIKVAPDSEAGIMRRKMCRMWTNFAKYSDPTPKNEGKCDLLRDFKWEPVKSHIGKDNEEFTLDCLDINKELRMIKNPFKKRMDFWREVYGKYNRGFLKPKL
ncbi:juvenile hormone esterase-like [Culicoides brevitarsis]|uniref:juvenile hormone esterase-like n=1 Tax=Culicoides brevitarsis TaxID=469753 RepID=UPI00307C103A